MKFGRRLGGATQARRAVGRERTRGNSEEERGGKPPRSSSDGTVTIHYAMCHWRPEDVEEHEHLPALNAQGPNSSPRVSA